MPQGSSVPPRPLNALHAHFIAILPRIEGHARICFRHIRCPGKRADAIAEVVAVAWRWFLRIEEQGDKDIDEFVTTFASLAARHVRSGRGVCGQERSRDVMTPLAQQKHHFTVQTLPAHETGSEDNEVMDALEDNTITPPPDQAAFRIDFAAWLAQLGQRNREIAQQMALSHTTQDLARKHKMSQSRISQLRREFHADWQRFTTA